VEEIARRLDIGRIRVYDLLDAKVIPGIKLNGRWIITRHAYDTWERTAGLPLPHRRHSFYGPAIQSKPCTSATRAHRAAGHEREARWVMHDDERGKRLVSGGLFISSNFTNRGERGYE
jgi:hypothetical protein